MTHGGTHGTQDPLRLLSRHPGGGTPPSGGSLLPCRISAALLLLAVLGLGACSSGDGASVGRPAPPFELARAEGRSDRLSDHRGKVVLLGFWATWCSSCREEIPALKALYERYGGDGFELLGASIDEDREGLSDFIAANKLPYPVLLADYATTKAYRVFGIPTKYLIDKNGVVVEKYVGETDLASLEARIKSLLDPEKRSSS